VAASRDEDSSYWIETMRGQSPESTTDGYRDHLARIGQLTERWHEGLITVDEKRRAISDENRQFYGPDCPKHLLWRPALNP
jgi:hypothetical protein